MPVSSVNVSDMVAPNIAPQLQLLSLQEVGRRLNVGHWMIYKLIGDNKLRTVKIGKRRLVSVQALQDFISQMERGV